MAKKFTVSDVDSLHANGYKPRMVQGEIVCDVEPPDNFVPVKSLSVRQDLDRKQEKGNAPPRPNPRG